MAESVFIMPGTGYDRAVFLKTAFFRPFSYSRLLFPCLIRILRCLRAPTGRKSSQKQRFFALSPAAVFDRGYQSVWNASFSREQGP